MSEKNSSLQLSHGLLQINLRSNTFIKPWNDYLCCLGRVKGDNDVILTTVKPWNRNVELALCQMILHSTCLVFARVTVTSCSSGTVHAIIAQWTPESARCKRQDNDSFYLPLLGGSWCRSCFSYTRSWGFLARRTGWSLDGLCRWADRWRSRQALCQFLLNPGEHKHRASKNHRQKCIDRLKVCE